jgi:hypothetical protein
MYQAKYFDCNMAVIIFTDRDGGNTSHVFE